LAGDLKMATIVVKQVRGLVHRPESQRKIVLALGLGRIGRTREINDTPAEADAFFPEIPDNYDVVYATCHDKDEKHSVPFSFVTYERITSE
jgi:ribosomal protein L30